MCSRICSSYFQVIQKVSRCSKKRRRGLPIFEFQIRISRFGRSVCYAVQKVEQSSKKRSVVYRMVSCRLWNINSKCRNPFLTSKLSNTSNQCNLSCASTGATAIQKCSRKCVNSTINRISFPKRPNIRISILFLWATNKELLCT